MTRSTRILSLTAVLFLTGLVQPGKAQTTIQFYSSHAQNNVVPTECTQEAAIVQKTIYLYDHPGQWRWIIVCDESAWQRVEQHLGRQSDMHGVFLALTDPDNRLTYVRGEAILHPFNASDEMQPDHTIRHELGHILQNNGSCKVAEKYAVQLLELRKAQDALIAENEKKSLARTAPGQTQVASASSDNK